MDVADAAILARISPCPTEAVVQHREMIARAEFPDHLGIFGRRSVKRGPRDNLSVNGFGVVRGDHATGKRDVGEILAICVESGVWRL